MGFNILAISTLQFPSQNDGSLLNQPLCGRSFDDSRPCISAKYSKNPRGLSDNDLLKSFSADKEKANNVAKIKVVVCPSSFSFFERNS